MTVEIKTKKIVVICEPKSLLVRYTLFKELMPNANLVERNDYYKISTDTHKIEFVTYNQIAKMGRKDQILLLDYKTPEDVINEIILPCDIWRYKQGAYAEYSE